MRELELRDSAGLAARGSEFKVFRVTGLGSLGGLGLGIQGLKASRFWLFFSLRSSA